jgi:hypothetical protein
MTALPRARLGIDHQPVTKRCNRAFTRIELLALISASALLLAVVWPALGSDSIRSQRVLCANNLSRIGQALASWAADHDERYAWELPLSAGGTPNFCLVSTQFVALSNELVTPRVLACPSDGSKSAVNNWSSFYPQGSSEPNVSYLLSRASLLQGRSILSGDRNLSGSLSGCRRSINRPTTNAVWDLRIHVQRGHFLFNDGSVEGTDIPRLRAILSPPGVSNSFDYIAPN